MGDERTARRILVHGIVQGVGFRPFVFQAAQHFGLTGEVANTSSGVTIHVEGSADKIDAFRRMLKGSPPPLAHITDLSEEAASPAHYPAFSIVQSRAESTRSTLISPDVAVCRDCLTELFDPADRRYRYPFINCTNCGPRYTIIEDIPYDRPKTSMREFAMCPQCQAEYDDPASRRFHAQPNACPACGPSVSLFTADRSRIAGEDPIADAGRRLAAGRIVAVKGLGGFHLAADAKNEASVLRLRARKHREEKPLALMVKDLSVAEQFCRITAEEVALLTSSRRPIVLLEKREPNDIAGAVAPNNRTFGVMLPYTPLHYLLLEQGPEVLVMTSGNRSEEPIAIGNEEAFDRLADIADDFLLHDREIILRSDDSIARHIAAASRFVRRSRGYVPVPVFLKEAIRPVLAVGAELKNTVCLTKGKNAFVSQHVGDLENAETLSFFEQTIAHLKRILDIDPELIAYDLHPDYLSTEWAMAQPGAARLGVQHHHAHIAGCLAEHHIEGPVIGLSFDGTGYGPDRTVWGGEVLIADVAGYRRAARLDPVRMPGSGTAIREPWRMAVSYLYHAFGASFSDLDLPLLARAGAEKIRVATEMIDKQINSPETSSLGRLFDGVAALCGLRSRVAFEGQAAMELEMCSAGTESDSYRFQWESGPLRTVSVDPIIRQVVDDLLRQMPVDRISGKFHNTLVRLFAELCRELKEETGLSRVALSGGVFQNAILLSKMTEALTRLGFSVFSHRIVPTNDGGISLGQAVVAAAVADGRKSRVDGAAKMEIEG
ncbi:MAG: carbamoyltransferase HypF [Desulfobacterales bacterium]|jgi:hydrogenase maturation protein HypF